MDDCGVLEILWDFSLTPHLLEEHRQMIHELGAIVLVDLGRDCVRPGRFPAGEMLQGPDGFLERDREVEVGVGLNLKERNSISNRILKSPSIPCGPRTFGSPQPCESSKRPVSRAVAVAQGATTIGGCFVVVDEAVGVRYVQAVLLGEQVAAGDVVVIEPLLAIATSLGTDDRDDLIKAFQRVVGHEVTVECSRFFLELANWNLQKGIGAYFDYSFEAAPGTSIQTPTVRPIGVDESCGPLLPEPIVHSARVYHSPNPDFKKTPTLIWCVQNSGPSAWPTGSYIAAEVSLISSITSEIDQLISRQARNDERAVCCLELPAGDFTHLIVDLQTPSPDVCMHSFSTNVPIVGALRLCLPNGQRFGDILYCIAVPDIASQSMLYKVGAPEVTAFESTMTTDSPSAAQPMEDL
ncbi:hypothetical protein SprV_0100364400 [Sparganum proliferum]